MMTSLNFAVGRSKGWSCWSWLWLLGLQWTVTTKAKTNDCNYVNYFGVPVATDLCAKLNDTYTLFSCLDSATAVQTTWSESDCTGTAESYEVLSALTGNETSGISWVCNAPNSGLQCSDLTHYRTYGDCSSDTVVYDYYLVNGVCASFSSGELSLDITCSNDEMSIALYGTDSCTDFIASTAYSTGCTSGSKYEVDCVGTNYPTTTQTINEKVECEYALVNIFPVPTDVCFTSTDSTSSQSGKFECLNTKDAQFSVWNNDKCKGDPYETQQGDPEENVWSCNANKPGSQCPRTRIRDYSDCEDARDDTYSDVYVLNDMCVPWAGDNTLGDSVIYTCENDVLTTKVYYASDCTGIMGFTSTLSSGCQSGYKFEVVCGGIANQISWVVFISSIFFGLFSISF